MYGLMLKFQEADNTKLTFSCKKGRSPVHKAPRFARVVGGLFIVRSLPFAFCKEVVSTTRTRDLPVIKQQRKNFYSGFASLSNHHWKHAFMDENIQKA